MDGIIVINKPAEFTSFDVVAVMRGVAKTKKVGHTGTLDPMATGVLPLLFGNATKAQSLLPDSSKEYIAGFKLGVTTDTLDVWGKVQSENSAAVKKADIEQLLPEFTGDIFQLPPMFSAVQKNGQRLYELARQGKVVEREKRQVNVQSLRLLEYNEITHTGRLSVACSKGTYIRTLIDDIGARLNCGGIMTSLCRTAACGFTLDDAVTLEQAKELAAQGKLEGAVKSVENLFEPYRQVCVTIAQAKRFCCGGQLDIARLKIKNIKDNEVLRVKTENGLFIGLGRVQLENSWLAVHKLFNFV